MPLQLTAPLIKRYILDDIDPTGETYVEVKQATQIAVERRASAMEDREQIISVGGVEEMRVRAKWNYPEIQRYEAYLTVVGCNIAGLDGEPLFIFKQSKGQTPYLSMNEAAFESAWGALVPDWAESIHRRVRASNPMWGTGEEDENL